MKKLIFFMTLALCSLFANAQQLEPNYHYSFWSNWNIGAGAVYSKPFDIHSWGLNEKANFGVDVRAEKLLSDVWTLRLDACIPGFHVGGGDDRYGTLMAGASLNLGRFFYLFADGGIACKRFNKVGNNNNVWLACDYGVGTHIYFGDRWKAYIEIGGDDASYFKVDNSRLFAKAGVMCFLGKTEKDRQNISIIYNSKNNVPKTEYDRMVNEKEDCENTLKSTTQELEKVRSCCQSNYEKYEKEISGLKAELVSNTNDVTLPFSILFENDSFSISEEGVIVINAIAEEMKGSGANYTLYGFGDYTGNDAYNLTLSQSRCESVRDELVKNGVDENKLKLVGLGKTKYFGTPESIVNRRVMFVKD